MRSPYEHDFCVHMHEEPIHHEKFHVHCDDIRDGFPPECHHEYPPYMNDMHRGGMIQADWYENNKFKPSYILNKPNFVERINDVEADEHGVAHINAEALGIGPIPNQKLFITAEKIFKELD